MNQIKIGKFLADMRRQQHFTQRALADALGISDKTVSKWECGSGMPELSLMLPVCKLLHIDLNELFSGEKLTDAAYKQKAEETIMTLIKEAETRTTNIVGGKTIGLAKHAVTDSTEAHQINNTFWSTTKNTKLDAVSLPNWGRYAPSEEKLHLLGDLSGKRVLEIGCGRGHSLKYAADAGASGLWGLDLSAGQIEHAKNFLSKHGICASLICSPMEAECGLPTDYFDIVYSVYGIGWTTDLDSTLTHIHSYLKQGGSFVFGWSHPIHKCVSSENGRLVFSNSYFNEQWYRADLDGSQIMLANRMMSTYINALADHGFVIERLVEETDREKALAADEDFSRKALMLPAVFIIKARKR